MLKSIFHVLLSDKEALKKYEKGILDFLPGVGTINLSKHRDRKTFPYLKTRYLGFNVKQYPFSKPGVRRAIAMAIDKKALAEKLGKDVAVASSFIPPQLRGYLPNVGLDFNPKAARKSLREAGIVGKKLKLEFLVQNWDTEMVLAREIKAQLKKYLGATVVIQPFTHEQFRIQQDLNVYPVFSGFWGADYPDGDNFLSVFLSGAGTNRTRWRNKAYDGWVEGARKMTDREERLRSYSRAQKQLIREDAVIIPLFYESNTALVKERFKRIRIESFKLPIFEKRECPRLNLFEKKV